MFYTIKSLAYVHLLVDNPLSAYVSHQ